MLTTGLARITDQPPQRFYYTNESTPYVLHSPYRDDEDKDEDVMGVTIALDFAKETHLEIAKAHVKQI